MKRGPAAALALLGSLAAGAADYEFLLVLDVQFFGSGPATPVTLKRFSF